VTLTIGQKLYYTGRGPCLVRAEVQKVVCGAPAQFYSFSLLDDDGGEFFVPVGTASELPLRPLLLRKEIPKLLKRLKARVGRTRELANWQQRKSASSKLFSSGSAFDLADTMESLMRSSCTRNLAMDEWQTLRRARNLLICEIAEVMNESRSAAESRLDSAANADDKMLKKLQPKNSLVPAVGGRNNA
jgi:RNA polymerase-interacting CarD/CdnL/TRCF family regulator